MTVKFRTIIWMIACTILLSAGTVLAEDSGRMAVVGSADVIEKYYAAVQSGQRQLFHLKTQGELLDDAKEAALETYDHLGIVDIGSGYLNVRRKPDEKTGNIIGKMLDGYAGEILKEDGDWYLISSGDVEGYVNKEFVRTGEKAREKALEAMELKVQITTETLNVRTEANEDSPMWTQVNERERYPVVNDLGDWIEIELDTSTGYVSSEFVEVRYSLDKAIEVEEIVMEDPENKLRQQIVDFALQYLGNPYVWGGESLTNGCDCSGFVMLIYREFGISLPHYSVSQSHYGTSISSSQMKKGDLVFYSDSSGTINHVTMYIGGGQIIGAQSRRAGITIKSWDYRTPVKIITLLD